MLLCAASLTRYEGWFAAGLCFAAAVIVARHHLQVYWRALLIFAMLCSAAPASWLIYNRAVYADALEFANGQYSAKAIEERRSSLLPRHPGENDVREADVYFIQSALGNVAESRIARTILFCSAVAGSLIALVQRRAMVLLLLWAPLPFYVYSVAYGSVPIFVPNLWPWSYYNARYGTALLPAIAVGAAIASVMLARLAHRRGLQAAIIAAGLMLVLASSASAYLQPHRRGHYELAGEPERGPLVWREAKIVAFHRGPVEQALGRELQKLPQTSRLLMSAAWYSGALQQAGIPFRRVINEGNSRPRETGGLWNDALKDPAAAADFVVAADGDPVAAAVATHPDGLVLLQEIRGTGQPHVRLFRSLLRGQASH